MTKTNEQALNQFERFLIDNGLNQSKNDKARILVEQINQFNENQKVRNAKKTH